MNDPLMEALYLKALTDLVTKWKAELPPAEIAQQMESNALSLVAEIRDILNDERLSDPECFYRIDDIVDAFYRAGISTHRHWEVD